MVTPGVPEVSEGQRLLDDQSQHHSMGQIFDDPMNAGAMLDCLLNRSTVLHIDGESYRMRAHRAHVESLRRAVAR